MSNILSTLGYGATVAVIGIAIVFVVLALLFVLKYVLNNI